MRLRGYDAAPWKALGLARPAQAGSRPCESGHVPGTAAADIGLIDTTDRYGLKHDFHAVPEGILRTGHHGQMPAAR
jgi:hypothetical protein